MPALLFCFDIKCCVHWKRVGKKEEGGNIAVSLRPSKLNKYVYMFVAAKQSSSGELWKKG